MGIRFGKFRLSCRFDASRDYLEIGPRAGAHFPQRITAIDDGGLVTMWCFHRTSPMSIFIICQSGVA